MAAWVFCHGSFGRRRSGRRWGESNFAISQIATDFAGWLHGFFIGIAAFIVDVDVVDCLPLLLWLALLVLLWRKSRARFVEFFKQPLPTFVLLNLLLQGLVTAVLFGSESGDDADSLLRYMPHVLLFCLDQRLFYCSIRSLRASGCSCWRALPSSAVIYSRFRSGRSRLRGRFRYPGSCRCTPTLFTPTRTFGIKSFPTFASKRKTRSRGRPRC